jgi:hypothetical protein
MLQRNATLTHVEAAGAGEAYDGPEAAGAEKWTGATDAYLRERRDRQELRGGGARIIDRVLLVAADLGVDWRSGDVVTFTKNGVEQRGTVKAVQMPTVDDPDIDRDVQTARLTLEPA